MWDLLAVCWDLTSQNFDALREYWDYGRANTFFCILSCITWQDARTSTTVTVRESASVRTVCAHIIAMPMAMPGILITSFVFVGSAPDFSARPLYFGGSDRRG